jgi:AcrR family transcriptional regulator
VRAGAELLDESGDEQAVTLRSVARRVGISAPSIYAHFPDRQAILLRVVQDAFAELSAQLLAAQGDVGLDPVERLRAACEAYLEFARSRPQRYRVMFAGVRDAAEAVRAAAVTQAEGAELGQDALRIFVANLTQCVAAGRSTSDDPLADAVALWLGLHGLAHQRAVGPLFPWPEDITERIIVSLAHLVP